MPSRHVKRLTDLFELDVECLELESLAAFKSSLGSRLGQRSPWQELLTRAIASDAIHLMRREENREPVLPSRGLMADDESQASEQFQLGERLYISLALTGQWIDEARRGDAYAVLLSADQAKTTCLCPSSLAPYPHLSSPSLLVPHSAPEKSLRVAGPAGPQSVLALLTGSPLTDDLYAALMQACATDVLNRLAAHITQTKDTPWQLLRKDYEVL